MFGRRSLMMSLAGALAIAIGVLPGAHTPTVATATTAKYNWIEFDGGQDHTGNNTREVTISAANVRSLKSLFTVNLPSTADSSPVYLSSVWTPSGRRDLVFLTTEDGHVLAIDAHSGVIIWSHQYGPGSCRINRGSSPCYTTSSPAIDPYLGYVYSYGLDGFVHKYRAGDGLEVRGNGWPERTTIKPWDEKGSSALSVATDASRNRYLYVTNGGYPGDGGDYQGHVTTINLATGQQHVFNTLCSDQPNIHFSEAPGSPTCPSVQSAVWARVGTVYDSATQRLYIATGNGDYTPSSHDWADSILALHADGTGTGTGPVDSYTPADYQQLQNTDEDLGSTAPAILPPVPGAAVPHLGLQGGKDALLRFVNLDNLSGQGGPGHTGGEVGTPVGVPQGGEVLTQPASWTDSHGQVWTFVANNNGISGLTVTAGSGGQPVLTTQWTNTMGGTSPIIANGVLYYLSFNGIEAVNPLTGTVLWVGRVTGGVHWESPIVDNGVLYVTDGAGYLRAFSLP